jgi:hypothetical protein
MKRIFVALLAVSVSFGAHGGESEAELISDRIQAYHMPFGVVGLTRFVALDSNEIEYFDDGDGAIWTGHYLAAEAFRYAVTRSETALAYAKRTIQSIKDLTEVTGTGRLARTMFPAGAPYIDWSKQGGTWKRTTYNGQDMYYRSHVTRDQYSGVYLGLALAYDLIDDEEVRNSCREIVTRMTDHLIKVGWILHEPASSRPIETFVGRLDHMLSILQVAKHMNPQKFAKAYDSKRWWWGWLVGLPAFFETKDLEGSYFKFNLDHAYFYNLIRLEKDNKIRDRYVKAYAPLRKALRPHLNAHFNMIDHALYGPDAGRDQETRQSIEEILQRGFRDYWVDNHATYKECEPNLACEVIPVRNRIPHDFLWQRSPFEIAGGGDGRQESPGIDYILPYWMARYFGVF